MNRRRPRLGCSAKAEPVWRSRLRYLSRYTFPRTNISGYRTPSQNRNRPKDRSACFDHLIHVPVERSSVPAFRDVVIQHPPQNARERPQRTVASAPHAFNSHEPPCSDDPTLRSDPCTVAPVESATCLRNFMPISPRPVSQDQKFIVCIELGARPVADSRTKPSQMLPFMKTFSKKIPPGARARAGESYGPRPTQAAR